jgi:serine/threonine-protein phosphatase 5
MHLARGNHESKSMNTTYGFEGEVKAKYSESIFELFSAVFNLLPLAHVLNNKVIIYFIFYYCLLFTKNNNNNNNNNNK